MNKTYKVYHNIPPVFDKNSKILILGSFPSPKSREQRFFYGHPQNRMWKALSAVFNDKMPESIEEKRRFLVNHNIAMWDVIESCEIRGASDSSIKNPIPNNFSMIFDTADIKKVFTTGRAATDYYFKLTGDISFMLPSPSPANCAVSLDTLIEEYKIILDYVN